MPTNSDINAFLERIKSIFSKKPTVANTSAQPLDLQHNAVRSQNTNSNAANLPTSPKTASVDSSANLPAFKQNAQDLGYSSSRGGDQAARRPQRVSSTYTKLQALSASGTGAQSTHSNMPEDTGLHDILNSLDDPRDQKKTRK
jgi:hypothetical protein